MIAAIAIDKWKLRIFKKHLDGAGVSYTEGPGLVGGTLLSVVTDDVRALSRVVFAADAEAARSWGA